MSDFDANEFLTSNFIKKDALKAGGPRLLTIRSVDQADGISRDGKPAKTILQLTFTDDSKFGLGTQVNLRRVLEGYGGRTSQWVGKTLELYYSPDVRGPKGEEGGIRIRIPSGTAAPIATYNFADALKADDISF